MRPLNEILSEAKYAPDDYLRENLDGPYGWAYLGELEHRDQIRSSAGGAEAPKGTIADKYRQGYSQGGLVQNTMKGMYPQVAAMRGQLPQPMQPPRLDLTSYPIAPQAPNAPMPPSPAGVNQRLGQAVNNTGILKLLGLSG